MIKEIYQYLTSKATKEAKKLGYLYSSIALEERFERCKSAWAPHILHCHNSILKFSPQKPSKIAILGSGHLLEIPWQELLNQGHQLWLIDIHHPKKVKALANKNLDKIHLIEIDITGFSNVIKNNKLNADNFLDFSPPNLDTQFDFVISANILSQLALNSLDFLQRKNPIFKLENLKSKFITKTGDDHWVWIQKLAPKGILFSDVTRNYISVADNTIFENHPSTYALTFPHTDQWSWLISPVGEQSKDYSMEMIVQLYTFENETVSK